MDDLPLQPRAPLAGEGWTVNALRSVSGLPPRGYCREGHPVLPNTMLGSRRGLDRIALAHDQMEMLERQALEIFTIQANAGAPFAQCLASVLLSGIDWGRSAK